MCRPDSRPAQLTSSAFDRVDQHASSSDNSQYSQGIQCWGTGGWDGHPPLPRLPLSKCDKQLQLAVTLSWQLGELSGELGEFSGDFLGICWKCPGECRESHGGISAKNVPLNTPLGCTTNVSRKCVPGARTCDRECT